MYTQNTTLANNIYIIKKKTLTTQKPQIRSKHKTQFLKFTHNVELLVSQSAQLPVRQNKTNLIEFNSNFKIKKKSEIKTRKLH